MIGQREKRDLHIGIQSEILGSESKREIILRQQRTCRVEHVLVADEPAFVT